MENLIRFLLRCFFKTFKVRAVWLKNPRRYPKTVLYISNHVSTLDILFLYAFLPERVCFALDRFSMREKKIKYLMRYADIEQFNPLDTNDIKKMVTRLEKGQSCAIFAEGKITETGNLMKIYEAPGVIADRAKVPFVPVWIDGAQYGYCSKLQDKKYCRFCPRTTLTIQKLVPFKISPLGKQSRHYISNEIYQMMQNVAFKATFRPTASFFAEFMRAAKSNAHNGLFERPQVVEDVQRQTYSYRDLLVKAYQYAFVLNKIIPHQKPLGVLLPNEVRTVCVTLGLMAYERVAAMLNYTSGLANVVSAISTAGIQVVLTSKAFIKEHHLEMLVGAIQVQGVLVLYTEDVESQFGFKNRFKAAAAYKRKLVPYAFSGSKRAVILFTSGSTGQPKGIVLSHQNLVANIRQFSSAVDINRTDIVFNCLPLFHCFGLIIGTFFPLLSGGRLFIYPSPLHYRAIPEVIYNIGATILFGTDSFLHSYAKVAHPFDFHTLRFVLGAAEPVQQATRLLWMERFGIRLFEGYGTTECSPFLTVNNRIFCNFNSIGKMLPAIEYKLKPVEGIQDGGSLCVKGPNIMLGAMTAQNPTVVIPPAGGWYDTGDIVSFDDMGFAYLKGRLKRFAKVAGEMVSLPIIETLVKKCYDGEEFDCSVVAIPHETKGEQLILVATKKDISMSKLASFIQQQGYSELYIPRTILYRENLPLLGSGKRDFVTLTQQVKEAMAT